VTQAALLQGYLRESARRSYEAVPCPPFTAFFHPESSLPYFNYAIPDEPAEGDLSEPLARLRAAFAARGRTPRFELVEGFAPGLVDALLAGGLTVELRTSLMACAAEELASPPAVPGLEIVRLGPESPGEEWLDRLSVQRQSFQGGGETTPAEAEDNRARSAAQIALLGRLEGLPVAAGGATEIIGGITEVVGVAVLPPFRRRGIGAAITARAAAEAYRSGATLALLTPGDEGAMRIYARAGFRPAETMVHAIAA
jgi:GNAT superfamily N-acetyltransferase